MATPYGHALMGLSLLNLCFPRPTALSKQSGLIIGGTLLAALSPDLDFIPGVLIGDPSRFHHGPFHSLGLALALSLVAGMIFKAVKKDSPFLKIAGFVFLLVLSHLILDYYCEDLKFPFGLPFFWPYSDQLVLSSLPIIPYMIRDITQPEFWSQNSLVFLVESLLLWPIYLATRLRLKHFQSVRGIGEVVPDFEK